MLDVPEVILPEPGELSVVALYPIVVDDESLLVVDLVVVLLVFVIEEVLARGEDVVRDNVQTHSGVLLVHQGGSKGELRDTTGRENVVVGCGGKQGAGVRRWQQARCKTGVLRELTKRGGGFETQLYEMCFESAGGGLKIAENKL